MSLGAYKKTIKDTETPRQIERRILATITADLSVHMDHFDKTDSKLEKLAILSGSLRKALSDNIKLWSALKMDLLHPENKFGPELRSQLISLALYVERQTGDILRGEGKVRELVDLNRSMIDGLSGKAPDLPAKAG